MQPRNSVSIKENIDKPDAPAADQQEQKKDTWIKIGTMWHKGKREGNYVLIPNPAFGLDL